MHFSVKRVKGYWRVVDSKSDQIAMRSNGTPIDQGGYEYQEMAAAKAKAENRNLEKGSFKA